jgi:hypothetical protein
MDAFTACPMKGMVTCLCHYSIYCMVFRKGENILRNDQIYMNQERKSDCQVTNYTFRTRREPGLSALPALRGTSHIPVGRPWGLDCRIHAADGPDPIAVPLTRENLRTGKFKGKSVLIPTGMRPLWLRLLYRGFLRKRYCLSRLPESDRQYPGQNLTPAPKQ